MKVRVADEGMALTDAAEIAVDPARLLERLRESGWDEKTLSALMDSENDCIQLIERSYPEIRGFDRRRVGATLWTLIQGWKRPERERSAAPSRKFGNPDWERWGFL